MLLPPLNTYQRHPKMLLSLNPRITRIMKTPATTRTFINQWVNESLHISIDPPKIGQLSYFLLCVNCCFDPFSFPKNKIVCFSLISRLFVVVNFFWLPIMFFLFKGAKAACDIGVTLLLPLLKLQPRPGKKVFLLLCLCPRLTTQCYNGNTSFYANRFFSGICILFDRLFPI